MNAYLGYSIGLIVVVPLGAAIATYATNWIAGFKPRYTRVLLSTIVAYAVVNLVGLALYRLGMLENLSRSFQTLAGWGGLTCAHVNIVRSETGSTLSPIRAVAVAFCQMFGAMIALVVLLWLAVLVKRVFV